MTTLIRDKTVSARVTADISDRAKKNLEKQGLTLSEYIRLSLVKAANNEVQLISFLDSPEALAAKKEAESGRTEDIGTIHDLKNWLNNIDETKN